MFLFIDLLVLEQWKRKFTKDKSIKVDVVNEYNGSTIGNKNSEEFGVKKASVNGDLKEGE